MRIKRQKYGRTSEDKASITSSHIIQLGAKDPSRGFPIRFRGFVVRLDSVGTNGEKPVDYEIMKRLGFDRAKVDQGIKLHAKAPDGCLPTTLNVRIRWSAEWKGTEWDFPGVATERFECWNKLGLFCHGNGETAFRKRDNGTRSQIECVPVGNGPNPCEVSLAGDCKPTGRFGFELLDADGNPLGPPNSIFRFETHSPESAGNILDELSRGANYCRGLIGDSQNVGHIARIRGALTVAIQTKRTGQEKAPTANLPIARLALSEADLEARRREIHDREISVANAMRGIELPGAPERALLESPAAPPDAEDAIDVSTNGNGNGNGHHEESDESEGFDAPAYRYSPNESEEAMATELEELVGAIAKADDQSPADCLKELTTAMSGKPIAIHQFFACRESNPDRHAKAMELLADVLKGARDNAPQEVGA